MNMLEGRGGLAIWRTGQMPGGPFSIGAVWALLGANKCTKMPYNAFCGPKNALKCLLGPLKMPGRCAIRHIGNF